MNQIKAGVLLNYVIVVLNILTGLLYTPFMLRSLGQNEYGLYSIVASVIAYLTLLDFGFGSAIVRYTARIKATGTKNDEWELYGMFVSGYTIIGVIVTIAGLLLYFNVDRMFDRTMSLEELHQARIMMALMVANLAVSFPFSVFGSIITAYEKFVFQRVVSIIRIVLSTVVLITVLLIGYKAIGLVIVQTIFSILNLVVNYLYCKYKLKIKVYFRNFKIALFKEIMVFSWWNFLGAIVDRIYWSTGQFVLGIYSGPASVAVFSVAISLMSMYLTLSTSFNSVLLPKITTLATDSKNDCEISNIFLKTGRLQFSVLVLIACGFSVFGSAFIRIWAGTDYSKSFVITLMFFLVLICPLIQNVGLVILQARGQQKFRSLCYLFIAIFSLIFQVILTKHFGVIGCATAVTGALFIGQWIIMNIYYSHVQHLDIRNFWKEITKMSIAPIFVTLIALFTFKFYDITNWGTLAVCIAIYLAVYIPTFWRYSLNDYERGLVSIPIRKVFPKF